MSGLTAGELAAVLDELRELLADARVRDVARLSANDDLLLFFEGPRGSRALHVAPGGARARLCTTRRRFPAAAFATTPQVARLRRLLEGARLRDTRQSPGERACVLDFEVGETGEPRSLAVELFGPRGLWCVLDGDGCIAELSRLPNAKNRELRPGARYEPPPTRPGAGAPPAGERRFEAPVCDAVDAFFTALDSAGAAAQRRQRLASALAKRHRKATQRVDGLLRQRESIAAAGELRQSADMLLAYGHGARRGDTELVVPHPERPDEQLCIALDPALPVHVQADALYKRARKLEDAAAISQERLERARAQQAELAEVLRRLDATDDDGVEAFERELVEAGHLPPERPAAPPPAERKITGGEAFRRFTSAEGHPILVGRNNQQNDRLTLRVARGNDLWLHVGDGRAGSHVVIRLPRGKTASLETLLDAATLAIHFSKARGNPRCDVVYTQAKHVRKPKGLPAGSVVPSHTKTITVRHDEQRLRRLLNADQGPRGPI